MSLTTPVTTAERERLAALEETIDQGMTTFIAVGTALAEVRDGQLYREQYGTFEIYCSCRHSLSRRRAYQMIEAAEVVCTIGTHADLITNERQARALAAAPPEDRADVILAVAERGESTAAAITDEVVARHPANPKPPPPPVIPIPVEAEPDPALAEAELAAEFSKPPKPEPAPKPPTVKDWPEVKEAERLSRPMRLMRKALKDMPSNSDLLRGLDADDCEGVDLLADSLTRWVNDWKKDRKAASGLRLVEDAR